MPLDQRTKKRMRIMLILVGVLFGGIFIYKGLIHLLMMYSLAHHQAPSIPVSTIKATYSSWQPKLKSTASLRAIRGVNVTTELAGMVQKIYFTPGDSVEEGTVLVQLNADSDLGQLHALQANAELAAITLKRDQAQYEVHAISKQQLDSDQANLKSLLAQVDQQAAIVAKKTIRAPFSGRLGISAVNPGQYLNPGDTVVMLQTLDPIYADFYFSQEALANLKEGQPVTITTDTFPGKKFSGKVTTINPAVDVSTRNVEVEATIANPDKKLAPGMFAKAEVDTGEPVRYLTVPQTAISFNPYGAIVYIVRQAFSDKKGNPALIVKQSFVLTGETRGDQIAILQGLKENDTVVTSGQLKLKNGSSVVVNNEVEIPNNPQTKAPDEH